MEPHYATFEQSKSLKEKNFNIPTIAHYVGYIKKELIPNETSIFSKGVPKDKELIISYSYEIEEFHGNSKHVDMKYFNWNQKTSARFEFISAPEHSQVVNWLLKTHGIWVSVSSVFQFNEEREDYLQLTGWQYYISIIKDNKLLNSHADRNLVDSPQEAYSDAFDHILNTLL